MLKTAMAALLVSTMAACSSTSGDASKKPADSAAESQVSSAVSETTDTSKESVDQSTLPDPINTALKYLDSTGFSKDGLIRQMEHDGYETGRAQRAIQQIGPDWNEQAAKAAESYLRVEDYSKEELQDLLKKAGFTEDEAAAGAEAAKK